MSARTLALRFTDDPESVKEIERLLVDLDDCHEQAIIAGVETFLEVLRREGVAINNAAVVRAVAAARDDFQWELGESRDSLLRETLGQGGTESTIAAGSPGPSTHLADIVREVDLFSSQGGVHYASVVVNGHLETWRLNAKGFRAWLARRHFEETGRAPRAQALQDTLSVLAGRAAYEGNVAEVHVRVASTSRAIYLDLADTDRQVIEVTPDGWRILSAPPVRFERPKAMLALPIPTRGGSIDELLRLLNTAVGDCQSMLMIQAWLLSVLQPSGARPLLAIHGEQGSAKSTAALLLKRVIDPSCAPLRSEPRDVGDLAIAANHSCVLAYDNLSALAPWLSDALCRLSTGGGLSKRELYSDSDETILESKRSVVLTGIEDLVTRPDLLDRSIVILLQSIQPAKRRTEEEILHEFDAAHPRILGALLDAAVSGLQNLSNAPRAGLPRMADFARWVAACSPALGCPPNAFLLAYSANRGAANGIALESSAVALAALRLVDRGYFEGTAQEVLAELERIESSARTARREWPRTARGLAAALRRAAPNLREVGVDVTFLPRRRDGCPIRLERSAASRCGETFTTYTGSHSVGPSPRILETAWRLGVGEGDEHCERVYGTNAPEAVLQ